MLSLIKFTSELNLKIKAVIQITATTSAVSSAIAAHFCRSPPESTATVEPIINEIEEVGPTATWRDVVKIAKNNPPARQQ